MTTRPGFSFCICPDGKLLRQQVEELLGAHPDAGRERHVFWGDDELPPKFWEILTLQGLFSTSRVLVMRNAHALTADVWKRLSAALSRPNPQTWPLFCLEVAWEKGQPKIPAHIAKLPCFTFADAKGWIWRSPGWSPARSAATSRYVPRRWGWIWNRAAWIFSPKRSFLTPPPWTRN